MCSPMARISRVFSPSPAHGIGASRWSTPTAAAAAPQRAEAELARELRRASPTATPNRRLVALADRILSREGRMTAAIAEIGRGVDCYEGAPFALELA